MNNSEFLKKNELSIRKYIKKMGKIAGDYLCKIIPEEKIKVNVNKQNYSVRQKAIQIGVQIDKLSPPFELNDNECLALIKDSLDRFANDLLCLLSKNDGKRILFIYPEDPYPSGLIYERITIEKRDCDEYIGDFITTMTICGFDFYSKELGIVVLIPYKLV